MSALNGTATPAATVWTLGDDAVSWRWWPAVLARMDALLTTYAVDTPRAALAAFIFDRVARAPDLIRAWAVVAEDRVIGHAIAWTEVAWGRPFLLVQSLDCERVAPLLQARFFADLRTWAEHLNARYQQAGRPERITQVRFWTPRDSAAWDRRLGGRVRATEHLKILELEDLG